MKMKLNLSHHTKYDYNYLKNI